MRTAVLMFGLLSAALTLVSGQDFQEQSSLELGLCVTGRQQSPVNIVSQNNTTPVCQNVLFSQEKSSEQGTNQGGQLGKIFRIEIAGENGSVQKYQSLQYHVHSQTEHTFDGNHSFLELHHVTQLQDTQDYQLAVFGVIFEIVPTDNQETSFFRILLDKVRAQINLDQSSFFSEIFENVLQHGNKIYTYKGSLTTYPCDEVVTWIILEEPIKVSKNSLEDFKKLVLDGHDIPEEGNSRPTQPLNGRKITYAKFCQSSSPYLSSSIIVIAILLFCYL